MCVNWQKSDWKVADKDIQAYKIVVKSKDGKYESPLEVRNRTRQDIGGSLGTILTYETGKTVTSEWPGVYLLADAINIERPHVVIKITIPKGTKFRRGTAQLKDDNGRVLSVNTINAMEVVVGKERPKQDTSWMYTNNSAYTTGTGNTSWGYATASTVTTAATTTYTQTI